MKPLDLEDRFFKSLGACFVSAFGGSFAFLLVWFVWKLIEAPTAFSLHDIFAVGQGLLGGLMIVGLYGIFSFMLLFVVGMPVHALLCRFRLSGYIPHVLAAALFGILVFFNGNFSTFDLKRYAFFGAWGFLYATIFWLIRRPDLDNRASDAKPVTTTTTP